MLSEGVVSLGRVGSAPQPTQPCSDNVLEKKRAKRIEGERLFRLAIFDTPDHVSLMQHPWYVVTAEGRVLVPRPRSHVRAHVFEYGVFFFSTASVFFFFLAAFIFLFVTRRLQLGFRSCSRVILGDGCEASRRESHEFP